MVEDATAGGRFRDRLILRLPLIGGDRPVPILERFCRILGTMISAGVPLPDAMEVDRRGDEQQRLRDAAGRGPAGDARGEGLAGPLTATGLFPGAARQMIRVGEETGTLDEQLDNAAEYYDRELDYKLKPLHQPVRAGGDHLHGRRSSASSPSPWSRRCTGCSTGSISDQSP